MPWRNQMPPDSSNSMPTMFKAIRMGAQEEMSNVCDLIYETARLPATRLRPATRGCGGKVKLQVRCPPQLRCQPEVSRFAMVRRMRLFVFLPSSGIRGMQKEKRLRNDA
jgi:hypothetical protein